MEEENLNKIIFNRGGVIIFVLIILLSGCIIPASESPAPESKPFEKVFNREAEDFLSLIFQSPCLKSLVWV